MKNGRRFEVTGKEVSSCLPFTYVLSVLRKRNNTDCRLPGCQSMGPQNRRRCPMGRVPRTGDQQGIRLWPGFPGCPRQYHGFHLSQSNASQWHLLDARGRITHSPFGHCGSGEIPEVLFEFVNDTMPLTYPPKPRNKPLSLWLLYMDCQLDNK